MPLAALKRTFRRLTRAPMDDGDWLPDAKSHGFQQPGVQGLRLGPEPFSIFTKLILSLALFALGIVAAIVATRAWGGSDVGLGVFLFIVAAVATPLGIYATLATLGPRLHLEADTDRFAPGETHTVRWSLTRVPSGARRLTLILQREERATYRRGTDTVTDTHTAFSETLIGADIADLGQTGEATFTIPADAPHSFKAPNNELRWQLDAKLEIGLYPDARRTAELRVWPGDDPRPAPAPIDHAGDPR